MKNYLIFFLLIFVALQARSQVDLEVNFIDCGENGSINIRHAIRNNTDSDKVIYDFAAPWSPSDYGVRYYAYARKDKPKNIKQDFFDYGSGKEIRLKKGDLVERNVNISPYLGEMSKENENEDIYIFWFYNFITINSEYKRKSNGFFVIPKNCYKNR